MGKMPLQVRLFCTTHSVLVLTPPLQPTFYADFVEQDPTLPTYIAKLERWRRDYERRVERKSGKLSLENHSHYLIEFQYQKFDEIEIPGQYLKASLPASLATSQWLTWPSQRHNEENNAHFVKILRFGSKFEITRARENCPRRITIIGHDGSVHTFVIQVPAARMSRREEKIMQFFRMLDWCAEVLPILVAVD